MIEFFLTPQFPAGLLTEVLISQIIVVAGHEETYGG